MSHYIKSDKVEDISPHLDVVIFSISQIKEEVATIISALPKTNLKFPSHWDNKEFSEFIFQFTRFSGSATPIKKEIYEHCKQLSPEGVEVIRKFSTQILAALNSLDSVSGNDFDPPQTLLLPSIWVKRVDYLLTQRTLPVAWIQRLDASKF